MFLELEREERERELQLELEEAEQSKNQDLDFEAAQKNHQRRGKRLLLAAERNRLVELVRLVHEDPSIITYADDDGYTALHRASYEGNKDCASYLIRHGADVDARTSDDWTPLHCAVRWNNVEVAQLLVDNNADINAKSKGGNTPLHIVASNGRYSLTSDIIQMLLFQPNCDFRSRNDSKDRAYDIASRSGPFHRYWSGVTTIMPSLDEKYEFSEI